MRRSRLERTGRGARRRGAALVLAASLFLSALPASADEYESEYAGHPLRMIAYVVHPFGVLVEFQDVHEDG